MKKIMLATAIVGLLVSPSFADTKVSDKTKIERIYTYKTAAVLKLAKAMKKNSGCTYKNAGKYVALRFGETGSKEMYSAALSAFVAGKNIKIGTKGCDPIWTGDGTMNKIYKIQLEK